MKQKLTSYFNQSLKLAEKYIGRFNPFDIYFTQVNSKPFAEEKATALSQESGVIICKILDETINYNEILPILLHELNHIKRGQMFSTEKQPTLFNWMLLEGLAITFEKDICGTSSLSSKKPDIKIIQNGLKQILTISDSDDWNYYDWFYNFDQQGEYPINFAYHIGKWLIEKFCHEYKIRPSQAIIIPPNKFQNFAEVLCKR